MANEERGGFWSTLPGILTGAAALLAAVTGLYVAFKHQEADRPQVPEPDPAMHPVMEVQKKRVMGPLERGIGLDHNDINPQGWLSIQTPEACSDMCYENDKCEAMTYVVSNQSCWLKYSVPARTGNQDEVSAVKQ